MSQKKAIDRREFLRSSAAAAATIALPTIIPASALGRDGYVAPSERIVMGFIGVGSQGRGNLNWFLDKGRVQVVAVCDVDRAHRESTAQHVDDRQSSSGCAAYLDYRELIGRGDLEAVATALPDQWHALPAIEAARAGLDIYGEKPLARTIRESRAIADAVHRYARVWQTGSWQRSESHFRHACELVRNGFIGEVKRVEVGLPDGGTSDTKRPEPVPDGLDWERWLGPAPWRPYCAFGGDRCHWDWRWILDFSGGQLTDWAGHHIDIAHWGLGLDGTGPIEIKGEGSYPVDGLWDAPTAYRFVCRYKDGLELTVANQKQLGFMGARWHGEDGWIHVNRDGLVTSDKRLLSHDVIGPDHVRLYHGPVGHDHVDNFLHCVRTRELTITPVETALRSISVGHLGEIAMQTGRAIRWDPEREEILDDPEASALLGRAYREPWVL